jgi:hypothetical protein
VTSIFLRTRTFGKFINKIFESLLEPAFAEKQTQEEEME